MRWRRRQAKDCDAAARWKRAADYLRRQRAVGAGYTSAAEHALFVAEGICAAAAGCENRPRARIEAQNLRSWLSMRWSHPHGGNAHGT